MSYQEIILDIQQTKRNIQFTINKLFENLFPTTYQQLIENFTVIYQTRVDYHQEEDITDYLKLRRLILEFRPALEFILDSGSECAQIKDWMSSTFETILGGAKRQLTGELKRSGLGGLTHPEMKYHCTICNENFAIPEEELEKILNSEEKISLPKHHEKELTIKIENATAIEMGKPKPKIHESDFSITHLLEIEKEREQKIDPDYITVTSVGIDIGTSTSHLIFSKLVLKREVGFFNMTGR